MAIANTPKPKPLQFKKRGKGDKKKVLIYGPDGSGKSTYAEKYCKKNGLKPVVLDIEDTNYTELPMLTEFDMSSDVKSYRGLKETITSIKESDEFDTIIIDGVDSIIESFISDSNGLKAYSDRTKTFLRFMRDCTMSDKNLIFIGQSPVDINWYKGDENPNKCIIKLYAIVNENYKCTYNFNVETVKYRVYGEKQSLKKEE